MKINRGLCRVATRRRGVVAVASAVLFFLCTPARPAKIGLDPLMGDGAAGQAAVLSGFNFEPSSSYTVLFGGYTTVPPTADSDPSGAILPTVLSLPSLPRGSVDVQLVHTVSGLTRTFTGAYRVQPNVCIEPGSGGGRPGTHWQADGTMPVGGWAGMVFTIRGTGFASGVNIAANSITMGSATTSHPAITVSADGLLPSTTVTISSGLANGTYPLSISDGTTHTFAGAYRVHRTIGLNPARGSRSAGTAITITGWGFNNGTIAANSITVGGTAGTHPVATVNNGTFTVTLNTGAGLGNGSANDVVINDGSVNTFVGAYYSTNPGNESLALWPLRFSGVPGEAFQLQGLAGFGTDIAANSIEVYEGNRLCSTVTHPAITIAGGGFPLIWAKIDGGVPTGANRLSMGKLRTDNLSVVPGLSVCPIFAGPGGAWTVSLTGWGMEQGAPSVAADSVTIGGVATVHAAGVVDDTGVFGPVPVTVGAPLPNGAKDIVVDDGSAGTLAFPQAVSVRRCIGLSFVSGPGTPGERVAISGTGFTADSTIAANGITFGGTAVTHGAVYVGANGTFSATVMDLPTLDAGAYDISAQEVFPAAYRVTNPTMSVMKHRSPERGTAGAVTTFSFSFTNYQAVGDPPAVSFVLSDNLPPLTQFVAGSAQCSLAAVTEWFDGGWTSVEPPASTVQAIRWTLAGKLPAGASGWASFQVQIQ